MDAESENLTDRAKESPVETALWFGFAAAVGFASIVFPPYVLGLELTNPPAFFPWVTNAIEHGTYWSLILLFGAGVWLGWATPRWWALKCCATMLSFPAIAILEMEINPKSHNLFPLEFIIYGAETIPALAGGYVGLRMARRLNQQREQND